MWDFVLLGGDRVHVPTAEVYILAAWHPSYSRLLGLGSKIGVLWTSSAGEMDLEPVEQSYLEEIVKDPRISFIWFGDSSLAQVYPEKGFYAPYPMDPDGVEPLNVEKQEIATLFCPTGIKKNILNQLLAMKLVQKERKLTLHTNVVGYDYLLSNNIPGEGLDCVRHSWLPQEEYYRLLASARINLACSWCETFNYNVAEAGLLGTPSVISPTIGIPGIRAKNQNSPLEIAEKTLYLISDEEVYKEVLESIRGYLRARNVQARDILSEKLSSLR